MTAVRSACTASVVLALAWAAVLAGPVAPSSAHAELISSTPADGASLASVPPAASLTFTDKIAPQFVRTAVTTPGGTGTVQATTKGQVVTVPVSAQGPGAYRVAYRVVSADGHPISGEVRFTVAGTPTASVAPSASAASSPPAVASPSASASASASSVTAAPFSAEEGEGGPNWLLFAALGLAVAAGGGAVVAATRGRRS